MPNLSKSKYLNGLQCRKLIWVLYNAKDKVPPYDAATQAIFDQGHEVGHLAKSVFPGGIEIEGDPWDYAGLLDRTRQALAKSVPLYEAAFSFGNAFARTDILNPVGDGTWDLIEVKSSTEVKQVHIDDLALQKYVVEGSGLRVRKCILMHINTAYVREGEVEVEKLFTQADVTARVDENFPCVEPNLAELVKVIRQKQMPDTAIGPHCDDPYTCILQEMCWAFLPEDNPLTLAGFKKEKAFELIHQGILKIADVPEVAELNAKQVIQREAVRTGLRHVDPAAILAFLETLVYPIHFLDFETFQTAIPLFDGVRPYQKVPFQFSLHIVSASATSATTRSSLMTESTGSPGAALSHCSYLSDGRSNPNPEVLKLLKEKLGDSGSIVCYNAAFERSVLNQAVEAYPEFQAWWTGAQFRLIDLLGPFRAFAFYHPGQSGSASLKAVLPVLTGEGYESLDIADGETASREYLRVTFGGVDAAERARVRKQLEDYCGLDTMGMIRIVEALQEL
jgi:hypothetical protein